MKYIAQISLALLLSLGSVSIFGDSPSIDINNYKVLLPEEIADWDSGNIKTIKLGEDNDILLYRIYAKGEARIEVQITANYTLLSSVWSAVKNPGSDPDASVYEYKQLKGVHTKEDGDINIEFLSGNELFIFGLTLLGQADKLSQEDLKNAVEGFLEKFDLTKLK